ncbi:glycine/betaine ABC transporter [Aerococcus urinaehominis]|uniref:Glycine/betaine ABC transporter n=1 Tax=Aerococcus urinaehominis TaxID=128944 RepID=A0A0X8FKZ5_9LACT|nr:glycine/betaine ABC transporter [Aerococcus urinaehominis]SDM46669.1 ABC-type proline/glycine betaine transport system, permease component [Aerococcus urinaehominis]
MLNFNLLAISQLPVANWVEQATAWMTDTFAGLFDILQSLGASVMDGLTSILMMIPPAIFILALAVIAYFVSNKRWSLPVFVLIGLGYVLNQGLWPELIDTVTLVLVSSLVSIIIGVPLGILASKSDIADAIIKPVLDFMQTMPAFVYLIPAVAFFGIGTVPGVFASVIFALPPTVRMTNLGIRQVPVELDEAAEAFGSTGSQKLFKVELPLAKSTIMAGINQTVMLALSMVVTGSMIGAPGLGRIVLSSLQRAQVGTGFVAGLGIVVLAIIIDRITNFATEDSRR